MLTGSLLPGAQRVAVDDHMWAVKVLALRDAMPTALQSPAGPVLQELRMRKSAVEVDLAPREKRSMPCTRRWPGSCAPDAPSAR